MTAQLTDTIRLAELDLADFQATTDDRTALRRLVAENPRHPLYLGYWGLRTMAALMGIATCGALAVPNVSSYGLEVLAAFPVSQLLPVATLVASIAFAVAAMAMRQAAVARGASSPLLPEEQKVHSRLAGKVHQLACARAVRDRMTPAPARVRITADPA